MSEDKRPWYDVTEPVRIYAFRTVSTSGFGGHFGWGLTPRQAEEACKSAGAKAKEIKAGEMLALPEGTCRYGMDGMGSIYSRRADGDERPLDPIVKMVRDPNGRWEIP